jgi:hypothetical protein
MIRFLKDSTFVVQDVINSAWEVLKRQYFSIAGLCFLLFLTSNASGILAFYFSEVHQVLSIFMALLFVLVYFGIQLTLFKYILLVLDEDTEEALLKDAIPTKMDMLRFFIAALVIGLIAFISFFVVQTILFPLVYIAVKFVGIPKSVAFDIPTALAFLCLLLIMVRIAFYPFFIIDWHEQSLKSIRLSLAITKGNLTKILLLLGFFAILHLLYVYFNYKGYPVVSTGLSLVNSFLVVPLSSVAMAVAYRRMMSEYKGDADPEVIKNLI